MKAVQSMSLDLLSRRFRVSDEAKSTQLTTIRHQLFRISIADVTKLYINDINTKKLMSYGRGLCGLSSLWHLGALMSSAGIIAMHPGFQATIWCCETWSGQVLHVMQRHATDHLCAKRVILIIGVRHDHCTIKVSMLKAPDVNVMCDMWCAIVSCRAIPCNVMCFGGISCGVI